MSRRPATFKQADLQRALRAARAAGVEVERVEIDAATGRIIIVIARGTDAVNGNALDDWLAKHARST